jgi:WD40 repeat protein
VGEIKYSITHPPCGFDANNCSVSRVFLSHSSRDVVEALALKAWLERAEPGLVGEIFLDLDPDTGIPAGVRWKEALRKANERCEAVICLLSAHWDSSPECKVEYRAAEDRGKPIFPVRLEALTGRDITDEWQRCDLFGEGPKTAIRVDGHAEPVRFLDEGLLRLQKGLRAAGIAPDSFEWPPETDPGRAPYRGWQPLEAVDAAIYFGRDAPINRALTAIRELRSAGANQPFIILGPSGVGKSSFLRAGLLPRLKRNDRHFLPMEIVRPQRNPLTGQHGLAHSIHALRVGLGLTVPAPGTIKAGAADPAQVRRWLVEAQQAAVARFLDDEPAAPPTIVLPIDQTEELFGVDAAEEADDFLTTVAGLLRDGQPEQPIVVVGTIRSDRIEPLQTARQLEGVSSQVFDDLKPMPADRYREVICRPAERAQRAGSRLQWAPELVERLLVDCAEGADALPLLSLTLSRLYEDYGQSVVGLAEYDAMGGMRRVVETEINAALSAHPETRVAELAKLHDAFIPWLATINPVNDQPLRRPARWADLPADSHRLIDALVAKRLLVKDERDGEVVVEVALESLLRQWDTLAGWLREEAADLKNTDSIEQAARVWDDNGRQDDWLLPGTRLADAEALAAKPGFRDRLNTAREYLLASRQREDRRAEAAVRDAQEREAAARRYSRRLKAVLAAVAVVAVAAVFGFGWALKARNDASARFRDATALRLYGDSQLKLAGLSPGGSDDVAGMQMLLAAYKLPSTQQGRKYELLTALHQERDLLKVIDTPADVTSAVFSPDGRRIASASADNTVRLWDAGTGQPVGEPLRGHENMVDSVAFSPDGRRLASGSADTTVRLWDAATGQPVGEPLHPNNVVMSVAFSPDGRRLASASGDTVRLFDAATGQPVGEPLRGHDDLVLSVAFSPDGRRLASASVDKTVRVWDAGTGQPVGEPLRGHDEMVESVAFSPDGRRLASAGSDQTVRLWDVGTGQPVGEPLRGHDGGVTSVAFSPDGRRLVSGADDHTVRVWDAASWQPMLGHDDAAAAKFSDDGRRIVSGGLDRTVRWWDAATGRPIGEPLRVDDPDVRALLPLDEDRLLSFGSLNTVRLWDAHTRRPIGEPLRLGPYDPMRPVDTDHEAHEIAARTDAGVVQLWDAATMRPVGEPIRSEGLVTTVNFSRNGRIVATGTMDGTVRLWDAGTGKPIGQPMTGNGYITHITFNRDAHLLAVGTLDSTLRLWDTGTFQPLGDPMRTDAAVGVATFSPDGRTLASGSTDGSIRLWDVGERTQLGAPLTGHTQGVFSLDFSPDGTKLLSGSEDHTLRVWPVPAASPEVLCDKLTHNMSQNSGTPGSRLRSPTSRSARICRCPTLPDDADRHERLDDHARSVETQVCAE